MKRALSCALLAFLGMVGLGVPSSARAEGELTVYCGRAKTLVGPLIDQFTAKSGIKANARYAGSSELAATLLEEGDKSPADVFFSQDSGALGAVAESGALSKLPDSILSQVEPRFHSPKGFWIGTSGRARVIAYNTTLVKPEELPASILDYTDPKWKGKIGWAPTNASFQTSVTGMRVQIGDARTAAWLKGIVANQPRVYENNSGIVGALGAGEVHVGFVNHYYLFGFLRDRGESFPVRNYYPKKNDPGALINVAGAAILKSAKNRKEAEAFLNFLLSEEAQKFFASRDFEYPLSKGVAADPKLKPIGEIESPNIDLGKLADLKGTLDRLRQTGVLQ